jgi:hypothetical protein
MLVKNQAQGSGFVWIDVQLVIVMRSEGCKHTTVQLTPAAAQQQPSLQLLHAFLPCPSLQNLSPVFHRAQARVAANRAYLRGLGLSSSAMQQGLVAPLDPHHSAVVEAARKLAKQAAVARAEKQVRAAGASSRYSSSGRGVSCFTVVQALQGY